MSRKGTRARGLPPSSASAQTSVAGSVGFHSYARGPGSTPPIGTTSASGRLAIARTVSPRRFHTSTSRGKSPAVTRYENGRLIRSTSTNSPLGDALTSSKIAGLPIGVFWPLTGFTSASWLVK